MNLSSLTETELKEALEWVAEFEEEIKDSEISKAYGVEAADVDQIDDLATMIVLKELGKEAERHTKLRRRDDDVA